MFVFAVIDYGLVLLFFICLTCLLLWSIRPYQQQAAVSVVTSSQREPLIAYFLLAGLFLLFIVLTAFPQLMGKRHNALG